MVMLEVVSLMEGEWFCYKDGLFNGRGMVVTEVVTLMVTLMVVTLMFNGGRMVMLQTWPV